MRFLTIEQAAHFGREAQEFSAEALQWLKDTVQGKQLWCQLLHRDQYGRIVRLLSLFQSKNSLLPHGAQVALPVLPTWIPFRYRNVSIAMLKAGWANVYEQARAEYGPLGKEYYLNVEKQAK
jgi:endonuclease YncB( thermonuclease family)